MNKQIKKQLINPKLISINYFLIVLLVLGAIHCDPYSLPDKKIYSEKDDPYLYYSESMEAYEAGDYDLALERIDQALNLNNNLALFYQHKGDIYHKLLQYDNALNAYKIAIKKRSNFIEVHETIGDIYQELADYNQAVRFYKKALALDKKRIDIILRMVRCYIDWNEYEVAQYHLDTYQKSADEFGMIPSNAYYVLRGELLFKMKNYEQSISYLSNSDPNSIKSLFLFGLNYYALSDYEKGVTYFNQLLKIQPDEGRWYLYRGIYFFQKQDYKDARSQFDYSLKLDPDLYEVHYYLGQIYVVEQNTAAALQEFQIFRQKMRNDDKLDEVNALIEDLEKIQ